MELWQRQGFESFGAWRRATESARRAAKKAASLPAPTASAVNAAASPSWSSRRPPIMTQSLLWEPVQPLSPPSAPNSPVQLKPSAGLLPGGVHEHVQVTPHGSRVHTMKHTSPGGTMRVEQYVSPAGIPQLSREERCAWRLSVAAARREAAAAREEEAGDNSERDVWRFLRRPRCGTCATCLELSRFGGSKHRASAPCATVLSRLEYTESERAIVCDPRQRFAR